ncbi:MAG: hypothetical protein K5981_01645 [Clostridia bacterium]|nr:hypothetical protein [Clostridia bacterium]
MKRRVLSAFMALVLLACLAPAGHVHADEEIRCPDCDVYVGDGSIDYCQYCLRCEDCCDMCYACDEICTDCHQNDFLEGVEEYSPCPDCGYCKGDGRDYCENCGRCVDCVDLCEVCGKYCPDCHDGIASDAEELPCPSCNLCKVDGRAFCEECGVCEDCADICGSCSLCDECALDRGVHCPECGECCEEYGYCEDGGDHCAECCESNGWICENCGLCCEALGKDMCSVCGLCEDCCDDMRESLGCTCSDMCWTEVGDDHLCADCGRCFGQVDPCDWCMDYADEWRCAECCVESSRISGCDCAEPVCVNSPYWDDHFAAFHASFEGSHSAKPAKGWSMDETHHWHACRYCSEPEHFTDKAAHSFDAKGVCSVCGFSRDSDLFILIQPKDQHVKQTYSGWCDCSDEPADDLRTTAVSFSVKVYSKNGAENLSYQWYKNGIYTPLHDTYYDDQYSVGTRTSVFTHMVHPRACNWPNATGPYFCVITDTVSGESVTTDKVYVRASHNYRLITEDGTDPAGHRLVCCGQDCGALGPLEPHAYGEWTWHLAADGTQDYRSRTCAKCNYTEKVYAHEHNYDFSLMMDAVFRGEYDIVEENDRINQYVYAFTYNGKAMQGGSNRAYHWIDCSVPGCTFTLKEEHQWGDYKIINNPNASRPGTAYAECIVCGMQKTWSKTYYDQHTHPVNVTDGTSDTDFASEGSVVQVFVTPQGDGRRVTGGTASIVYTQTLSNGRTSIGTNTVQLRAVTEGQTYGFTVPRTMTTNRGTVDYGSNPINVEFTYAACDHAESERQGVLEASCVKDGYTGDLLCDYCGELLEKGTYIAPKGHGEPVLATENVFATDSLGNIVYHKRGEYSTPVYLVHAPQDVYCDDPAAKGCYSGDWLCPDCGEVIRNGEYSAKLHYYTLLDEIDEPAYSEHVAAGLKPSMEADLDVMGYTGDMVCTACGAVKYGKPIPALPGTDPDVLRVNAVTLYGSDGNSLDHYDGGGLSSVVLDCGPTRSTPAAMSVLIASYDPNGRFIGCELREVERSDLGSDMELAYSCGSNVSRVVLLVINDRFAPINPLIPLTD